MLLLTLLLGGCGEGADRSQPLADDGRLDLTASPLAEGRMVALDGEWHFHPGERLEPAQLADSATPTLLPVPAYWDGLEVNGTPLASHGQGTYHLRVQLPEEQLGELLALHLPSIMTSHRLWLNGQLVSALGTPAADRENASPRVIPTVVPFQTDRQELELVLQVANHHHREGGLWESIKLGPHERVTHYQNTFLYSDLLLLGGLLIAAAFHLTQFAMRRRDRASLYFGLFCALIALRIPVTGEKVLMQYVPGFNWSLGMTMEYLGFYLASGVLLLYVQAMFPDESRDRPIRVLVGLSLAFSALVLVTPPHVFTQSLPLYQLISLVLLGYAVMIFLKATWRRREGALFTIGQMLLAGVAIINDILLYQQVVQTFNMFPFALLLMVFGQSMVLSSRLSKAFTRVEELSEQQRRWQQELEHKVAERTVELDRALSELKATSARDPLTGVANRGRLNDALETAWKRAARQQTPVALLLLDIDFYKVYNDTYGHLMGDECLKQVARLISDCVQRPDDLVARYGGEEFCVLLPDIEQPGAAEMAERIRATIEGAAMPHESSKVADILTVSVGVAVARPASGTTIDELIHAADEALYAAKSGGRNRVVSAE